MKLIAIEEHFLTESYVDYLCSRKDYPKGERRMIEPGGKTEVSFYTHSTAPPYKTDPTIFYIGEKRLNDMDRFGIDMQILSLGTPVVEALDAKDGVYWARQTNNELADLVAKYKGRFAGLAAIAPQEPQEAAGELERAVKELGFKGAKVNSHINGEYLDDRKYWTIFEKAEKLGVPIYLHPREPSPRMLKAYEGHPWLLYSIWGYGAEVGLHVMRLICSGVFDQFPRLKIILGHMGEALPFWLWRLDNSWSRTFIANKPKRKPSEYFKDNFLVTTSGMFSQVAFTTAYQSLGADNILFAVDY